MSRLMSVAYTEEQVIARRKHVTRRAGWWLDKRGRRLVHRGDTITLCRKVMGRKPGEPLVRIVDVTVLSVRREPLARLLDDPEYGAAEMVAEGFPGLDPAEFIERYFLVAQGMSIHDEVTRLAWNYPAHDRAPVIDDPALAAIHV